ncbi:MAG: hypothetical protein A3G33_09710 [Omnitrophica bacterium RIFCSPLOWO2_12_FULL_44_17]|uniref:Uncharacterized protein n=1 Tax=Candidatus Danuiimicrobium aquiferis TaxID=1801832 RepID=A0A1G1KX64_9BACT|nr:MAG: hypothetical protein A3B72_09650 [Omnitrophica bacterium RIFCSPHIGHO2_02_FULL_45_28]OGW89827.1 MAG: hypothetical protein A3E74_02645 [Omnitrophica bacterium RIFCSPHIGHO2_12_FULL_44_12]OGW97455.1 MAG: hypothetical protein A3G33_09710 [Omnitrophica bacterium RIFCSPLOWO2_12_FULL_44_17]OGX04528.1 MAG: hypothetical protein A3J12_10750 [Omnitrophica bacterium RIFCSPLOWO2_02_FULL_44_11]
MKYRYKPDSFFVALIAHFLFYGFILLTSQPCFSAETGQVNVIALDDATINPVTAAYITKAIDRAAEDRSECLIIKLDTPGGLVTSTREIVKKMMSSTIPVVVYVAPSGARAGSAGVFITYASHVAAMAPSTNIGAAHPVEVGGGGDRTRNVWDAVRDLLDLYSKKLSKEFGGKQIPQGETKESEASPPAGEASNQDILSGKILNDTLAFIKAIAVERNRNVEWAVKAVRESASITETEAKQTGVIEIIAKEEQDLLTQLDGRVVKVAGQEKILKTLNVVVKEIPMSLSERILNVLAHPNIAYIFMMLGFYGLLFEVTHPGTGIPGILGTIFIVIAFFSMQMLPTNYAGLALIILAIVLFIADVKVPGFGFFTLAGLVSLVLGSLLLFQSQDEVMRLSMSIVMSFAIATAMITTALVRLVFLSHRRKIKSGKEAMIGEMGEAFSDFKPNGEGKVFIVGEIWDAVSKDELRKGDKVKILKVKGLMLEVEKVK